MLLNKMELEKIEFCAELCHLVYDPKLQVNSNLVSEIITGLSIDGQFKFFNILNCDTQALVLEKGDLVYVVFRGTQTIIDWCYNFILKFKTIVGVGSYHSGFMKVSEESFPHVGDYILKIVNRNPNAKVVLTGHSLGGAMATMYSFILKQKYPHVKIQTITTFGQPRCGDREFANYLNSFDIDYKRFVNDGDYIADVPPPNKLGAWSHAGLGYVLNSDEMVVEGIVYENNLLLRIVNLIVSGIQLVLSNNFTKEERKKLSSNHDMPLYIQRIQKEIARK